MLNIEKNQGFREMLETTKLERDQLAMERLKSLWGNYKQRMLESGVKISQAQFAHSIGIDQSTFAGLLTGKRPIGGDTLLLLAEALDCDISDIRQEYAPRTRAANSLSFNRDANQTQEEKELKSIGDLMIMTNIYHADQVRASV